MTANTPQRVDVERLSELLAVMASSDPNRMTEFPGGCDCYECGCIFIGGAGHDYCAQCEAKRQLLAMLPEALPALLQQLAEREAEITRLNRLADAISRDCNDCANQRNEAMAKAVAAERAREECASVLREALRGWDDLIEDLELNGLHDDPRFNYRRQKEWIGKVEAKAGAAFLAANGDGEP